MSNSTVHNLLVGSWDLSTAIVNKENLSDKMFWGATVADLVAGQWGVQFPTSAHRADARVTSGAEYVLSFFARADVAGDKIHSDVWGSKYMLNTTLTTEWQQVVMPYGIVNADSRDIYFWVPATNSGTVYMALPMCVRGTEPAAWAPAEGETLAGGGALMSANLLAGVKPEIPYNGQYATVSDGVFTSSARTGVWYDVAQWILPTTQTLAENQTFHIGISAKWHGTAATKGSVYAAVKYEDAAGNTNSVNAAIDGITTEWKRFSLSAVVPSGMRVVDFHISAQNLDASYDATNPVLSYGSPVVLAIASSTIAWSAGIVATTRYYQLAAPTAATPTVPTSSSSLGSWTETEPTADVTKVLWTCERTVYADGTESWSKASKSTSYEAAKDAKSTATDAQQKAQQVQEQVVDVSTRLDQNTDNLTATIESKVALVQQDVDSNTDDVSNLNKLLTSEIKTRQSFMRFSEESSDPTLTLGQTDSPAQVKLTNKQLQFLYLNTVVAYMSGDALLINNAQILQQLQLGGFVFVPRDNGNLAFKWVGGD